MQIQLVKPWKKSIYLHCLSSRLARKIISEDAHASTKRHRITWRGKKQERDCSLSAAGRYYTISTILFKHPLREISSGAKCWPQERWDCEQTHSLCLVSLGNRASGPAFLVMGSHQRQCYPACHAAKQLQSGFKTEAVSPDYSHTASSSKADCSSHGENKFGLSAKHWVDIPRETSDSTGFFSIPGGNNEKYSKFWLTD